MISALPSRRPVCRAVTPDGRDAWERFILCLEAWLQMAFPGGHDPPSNFSVCGAPGSPHLPWSTDFQDLTRWSQGPSVCCLAVSSRERKARVQNLEKRFLQVTLYLWGCIMRRWTAAKLFYLFGTGTHIRFQAEPLAALTLGPVARRGSPSLARVVTSQ